MKQLIHITESQTEINQKLSVLGSTSTSTSDKQKLLNESLNTSHDFSKFEDSLDDEKFKQLVSLRA